jgi:hypothetical protein
MTFGDGDLGGDASMADSEERMPRENIRRRILNKLSTFSSLELNLARVWL